MNRVCLTKTGKLIEMQSGGESDDKELEAMRLDTLKQNALNAGYKEDEIDVKWVTDDEWAVIQEANKPVPTYAELRKREYPPAAEQLDMIYWDKVNNTNNWQMVIEKVKRDIPKI